VAGLDVLQPDDGDDVAGLGTESLLAGVGVHLDHAPDALGLAGEGVEHGVALLERAGVDPGEGERAVAVVHDLEGERAQRAPGIDDGECCRSRCPLVLGLGLDLGRIGQVIHDRVEDKLHALVLEGGTAVGGEEIELDGALADAALEVLDGGLVRPRGTSP
jgi:hypothetical protein